MFNGPAQQVAVFARVLAADDGGVTSSLCVRDNVARNGARGPQPAGSQGRQ